MNRFTPPIVFVAAASLAGIALGLRLPITTPSGLPGWVLLLIAALAAALLPRTGVRHWYVGFLLIGWALGTIAAHETRRDCRVRITDGARLEFRGTFESAPWQDGAAPFLLEEVRAGGPSCEGRVRVRIRSGRDPPVAGAEVMVRGRWWTMPKRGDWPRRPRWAGTLVADTVRLLAGGGVAHHPLLAARGGAQQRLRSLFGDRAPFAEAVLLAQKNGIDDRLRDTFARSGISHLLAISGLHVGLVTGLLLGLARVARLSPRMAAIGAGAATIGYVLFIGAPDAASRAAFMLTLLLASRIGQRPADPFAVIAAAALVLAAGDPIAVLGPGFQLSFAGAAGIVALRRPLGRMVPRAGPRWLRESVILSVAATLATAPIAALHFGLFSPVGVLVNIVAVPLAALTVPALAFTMLGSAVHVGLGEFLADGAALLVRSLEVIAHIGARVPGGHMYASWMDVFAVCAATGAAVIAYRVVTPHFLSRRTVRRPIRAAVAVGVAVAVLVAWPRYIGPAGGGLEVHVIDVGQGDAIGIRSPHGRWLLVDTGPKSATYDAGRARVVPYLLRHGANRLEALILTHPDADHIGGAASVWDAIDVPRVVDPGAAAGKPLYISLLEGAGRRGRTWFASRSGARFALDGIVVDFLYPPRSARSGLLDGTSDANDLSVVFRLRYGDFTALFLGDAPAAVERWLVRRHGERLSAMMLKVGHHGSATSTATELLDAVRPELAVIPVGRRNRYGHPDETVLERLAGRGIRVLRTDSSGAIRVRAHASGRLEIRLERGPDSTTP